MAHNPAMAPENEGEVSPENGLGRRRTDAQRNNALVLQAALEVFGELGIDATVPQVAARAGVGKATVYRCFPTKEDLVAAVASERMQWLADRIVEAMANPDVLAGFSGFIVDAMAMARTDRMLGQAVRSPAFAKESAIGRNVSTLAEQMLTRAVEAGVVRADATVGDLRLLISGMSDSLAGAGDFELTSWDRAAELVKGALRPDPITTGITDTCAM
jgi:AcrR family transcriptional regulator